MFKILHPAVVVTRPQGTLRPATGAIAYACPCFDFTIIALLFNAVSVVTRKSPCHQEIGIRNFGT
jgi:hypothetical protein